MENKTNIEYEKLIGDGGHYKTKGIFYEYKALTKSDYCPFNLKERDLKNGSISMYRIYMSCDTEYDAAKILLNSWKHWEILCDAPFFRPFIEKWREEREIRDASMARKILLAEAEEGNVTAAKAVYDQATKRKAGRPSKAEVEGHKRKMAAVSGNVANIVDRMAKYEGK